MRRRKAAREGFCKIGDQIAVRNRVVAGADDVRADAEEIGAEVVGWLRLRQGDGIACACQVAV